MTVPTTPAQLTGTIAGAIVSGTAPTITFNRPVNLGGVAADVTIIKASAPTAGRAPGPAHVARRRWSAQLRDDGDHQPRCNGALTAGDVITVKRRGGHGCGWLQPA